MQCLCLIALIHTLCLTLLLGKACTGFVERDNGGIIAAGHI